MSLENAKAFYEKVIKDRDLFNQIGQIQQDDPGGLEGAIIKLAAAQKYDFTVEEMKTFLEAEAKKMKAGGELSDSELEAVAGGKNNLLWAVNSIFTAGIYCAVSGIQNAINDPANPCMTGSVIK
jgi:predicted ribosomally synthesized peptide with nif11-like leader